VDSNNLASDLDTGPGERLLVKSCSTAYTVVDKTWGARGATDIITWFPAAINTH